MLKHLIIDWLPTIYHLIEVFGIIIIFVGSIKAFIEYAISLVHKKHFPIKIELANALALGLGFKMAAEILKTILIQEMSEIYMLGALILLHGFLTVLIQFEINAEEKYLGKGKEIANSNTMK